MNIIQIIVDCKESKLFVETLQKSVPCNVSPLNIGDIAFSHNNAIVLYIERKTINDLAASIRDGRYHEQKARLKGHRVIYLIEEGYEKLNTIYHSSFDKEKYKGCIINTMVRDNIHVYQTNNMSETCQFIADIAKRMPRYINDITPLLPMQSNDETGNVNTDHVYTNALKMKKKDNVNPTVCFINQLSQIPGLSTQMAQVIAEKYKCMNGLLQAYGAIEEEELKELNKKKKKYTNKEKFIADLIVNNRKIGPIVSKRLYEYLFNISEKN